MLSSDVAACSDFIASMHTPSSSHEGEADNNKGCYSSFTLSLPLSRLSAWVTRLSVKGSGKRVAAVLVLRNFILTLLAAS